MVAASVKIAIDNTAARAVLDTRGRPRPARPEWFPQWPRRNRNWFCFEALI